MAKGKARHDNISLSSTSSLVASSDSEASSYEFSDSEEDSCRHTPDPPEQGWICPNCDVEYHVQNFESPIPTHLLNTNLPPLASEEHLLRETLGGTDIALELAKNREVIRSLKATLSALERRQVQLQESLVASKGVFSPIRRLPREIIGEIILYAVGFYGSVMDRVSLNTRIGIWAYSHVCRLWRSEILSRAAIWSLVDINEKDFSSDALREVSVRAGKIGLDLCITLHTDIPSSRQILYSAIGFSLSWVKVQFRICTKLLACLKRLKNRIPKLQCLDIRHNSSRGSVTSTPFRDCFATAPALRRITFEHIRNIDDLDLPWSQITHFCSYSGYYTFQLIRRMTQLTHLYHNGSVKLTDQSVVLPYLKYLRVRTFRALNLLVTPALEVLHASEYSFADDADKRLTDLFRRSSCAITTHIVELCDESILWEDDDTSDDDFIDPWISSLLQVCKLTPQLTILYFHEQPPSPSPSSMINDSLLAPFADATLLPQLHTLIFDGIALKTEKACNAIYRLVRRRRRKESSHLQELHFVSYRSSSGPDFSHIFNGLDVKILITENPFLSFAADSQLY